ncbi:unnamed protein product [Coregonus sp. 'balchen']|nr:unnamed protein product [Coregonus sp. 'balchen']
MAGVNSRQQRSVLLQQLGLSLVTSALEGSLDNRETGADASQAGGRDGGVGADGGIEQQAAFPRCCLHKHNNSSPQVFQEERLDSKQKGGRLSEENHEEGSPRVTRNNGGEELPSSDSLKTDEGLCLERGGVEEVEKKTREDGGEGHTEGSLVNGGIVFKVKVGKEGEEDEDQKMDVVVKSEQVNSSYPDTPGVSSDPPFPSEDTGDHQDEPANDEKDILSPKGDDTSSSNPQSSSDPQTETDPLQDNMDGGDGSSDNEGLDSNQDLGLSCILNPISQLGSGPLGEDSLPNTTISESQAESNEAVRSLQSLEATNASSFCSASSSSLMFPVTSVPFQQLLAGDGHSFSEGFILQPTQTQDILGGFLRGVRPDVGTLGSLSLSTSLSRTTRADIAGVGGSLGAPANCRIAPKTEHNILVVEGARKYACRICCKTFLTLTDCKKHIRVHTGKKPYACLKCGKRFSQSSHLYKHSKTTGLRWQNSHLPATLL